MIISGPKNTVSLEGSDQGNKVAKEGNEGNEDQEFIELLNNVEELFG